MLRFEILNFTLYEIINWFYIYSFIGWIFESTYVSCCNKKMVNRGFMTGPFCTIYGFGALIVYLVLYPVGENIVFLFLGGFFLATILEYLTGVLMELIFHTSWWDYRDKKIQFQGKICLSSSIAWGVLSVLLFKVMHPFVSFLVGLYSIRTGTIALIIITILAGADFTVSLIYALKLNQKLKNMSLITDEFYSFLQNIKLSDAKDEIIEKLNSIKIIDFSKSDFKNKIDNLADLLSGHLKGVRTRDRQYEIAKRLNDIVVKYTNLNSKTNYIHKRFIKAYPNLKSRFQKRESQLKILKDKILKK